MRVALWSGFDRYTGYGNDAVDIALNLDKAGVDVVPWPTMLLPGLPKQFTDLLTKEPSQQGRKYDIILCFAPPFDVKPREFAYLGERAIGWSMWEKSPLIRADMAEHGWKHPYKRRAFWGEPLHQAKRKEHLDMMLVTCPMNVEAFSNVDPHVPYRVLPCGIEPDDWPKVEHGHPDGRFRFGMIGMLAGRKDPWIMLEAWRELKEEHPDFDAVFEMKTACGGLPKHLVESVYRDVIVHEAAWPRQQVRDWYKTIDVLVSTSRGEGNNKPGMEFMASGGPVIASDWSGHQNWNHEDWGYPVRGNLVANNVGVSDFRVDKQHLKERIMEAYNDRARVRRKGDLAHGVAVSVLSWESVTTKLVDIFGEVLGSG